MYDKVVKNGLVFYTYYISCPITLINYCNKVTNVCCMHFVFFYLALHSSHHHHCILFIYIYIYEYDRSILSHTYTHTHNSHLPMNHHLFLLVSWFCPPITCPKICAYINIISIKNYTLYFSFTRDSSPSLYLKID